MSSLSTIFLILLPVASLKKISDRPEKTKSFIIMLFQLSCTDRHFEFESELWSDPSGVDERTEPWFWAKGCVLRSQALVTAGKMLIFIQD